VSSLKQAVVAAALEAGAGAVRVCDALDDDEARTRFAASVERGDLGTWPYDRAYAAAASSPRRLLPGARSLVCVAVPFATSAAPSRPPLTGRVSNYAWAADYHPIVRRVLRAVATVLDDAAGGPASRIACDTLPIAERAFAARAGVGWVGKHTNLIAPGLGSFVFVGEVITTVPLPADAPLRKHCGSCRRCVVACPTGALRGDYTMDATRCISDLTQRTDAIPRGLRPLIGDWVWGCDLCQEVCPPTQRASARGADAAFAPTPALATPDLVELLGVGAASFRRRFRRTSLGWRGPEVLRRNAAVALGNALDRSSVPALTRALAEDPSQLVRGHVAWALGRIGSPGALSALSQALHSEADYAVRGEIRLALEPFRGNAALGARRSNTVNMLARALVVALLVGLVGKLPTAAEGGAQDNAVYHRMAQMNAGLHSYKADLHADIALKTFPYLSPSLDGNLYFKQPDKQAVIFDTVPALAAQFKKLYPHIEPPAVWPSIYAMTVLGDDNGTTTFRLVPKKHGRVVHLDVKADDGTATIRSMTWTYEDGGYVTFDQSLTSQGGNYLVKSQTGHVELPSYKADVKIAISNYKVNVAVGDEVFDPDK
jgi:epoxyqueuosine reductase